MPIFFVINIEYAEIPICYFSPFGKGGYIPEDLLELSHRQMWMCPEKSPLYGIDNMVLCEYKPKGGTHYEKTDWLSKGRR